MINQWIKIGETVKENKAFGRGLYGEIEARGLLMQIDAWLSLSPSPDEKPNNR